MKGELEARTKELAKEQERHKKLSRYKLNKINIPKTVRHNLILSFLLAFRELAELKAAAAEEAGPSDAGPSGDGRRRSGRRSGHAVE